MRQLRVLAVALSMACVAAAARAATITAGPMVGHVTDKSARIWMQTSTSCEIAVDCYELKGDVPVCSLSTEPIGPSPFTADIPLSNLEPNKSYRIEIKLDDKTVAINGPQCVIRTNPPAGSIAAATVAFGSCMDVGKGGAPIFRAVDAVKPRAFLFLGNTAYLPEPFPSFERDGVSNGRLAFRFIADNFSELRKMPELQSLFRTVACYGAWNDRDYGGTNSNRMWQFSQESWAAFQRFWPNPDWGTPSDQGCYYRFTMGDADFFVLDPRSHRDPAAPANGGNGGGAAAAPARTMLGVAQLDWLKAGLLKSTANFKIIACGSPLLANDAAAPGAAPALNDDAWAAFQPEQQDFLSWLGEQHIAGVVFVSGTNRGYGELSGMGAKDSPTHYPLLELTSSALAGNVAVTGAAATVNPLRMRGPVVGNNFGTIDLGGDRFHRFLTLRLRDADGTVQAEQTVSLGQLQGE
ncbi:MAG: alkaline phosphatase D family protein [Phycisphaerae bacterium]